MEYFEATLQCSCKILEYCERFLKILRDFQRLRKILDATISFFPLWMSEAILRASSSRPTTNLNQESTFESIEKAFLRTDFSSLHR